MQINNAFIATITTLIGLIGSIFAAVSWINDTVATKQDLTDIERNISMLRLETRFIYNEQELRRLETIKKVRGLTDEEKREYEALTASNDRMRARHEKLVSM